MGYVIHDNPGLSRCGVDLERLYFSYREVLGQLHVLPMALHHAVGIEEKRK
jgi:hypothetical protein